MEVLKNGNRAYEVERRVEHAGRPGFRITELQPGQTYSVPARRPHLMINGGDSPATFLVLQGIGEYDYVPLVKPKE
jgi:oxalate decarboxylase/phosphoglucose isomerase-like protein (cupin superfamily)